MDLKVSEILASRLNELNKTEINQPDKDFSFTLNKIKNENLSEKLNGLIEEISITGKKLTEHMDINDFKKYRSLVGDFMNEIVTNSHEFSRENFLDSRGRHRVYGIVKKVDDDLDSLAQELLKEESDRMVMLEKTDDIQGLLLDLMV